MSHFQKILEALRTNMFVLWGNPIMFSSILTFIIKMLLRTMLFLGNQFGKRTILKRILITYFGDKW